jgi:hypothetical protein
MNKPSSEFWESNRRLLRAREPWKQVFDAASRLLEDHGSGALAVDLVKPLGRETDTRLLAPLFESIRAVPAEVWAVALPAAMVASTGVAITAVGAAASAPLIDVPPRHRLDRSLRIPDPVAMLGPVTRARQHRMVAILCGMELAAFWRAVAAGDDRGKAFAVGLMAPGAGFVFTRDPAHLVLTIAAFVLSLLVWWATANILLPPAVWLAAAVVAARRASHRQGWRPAIAIVPATVASAGWYLLRRQRGQFGAQVAAGRELNQWLTDVQPPLRGEDRPPGDAVGPELGEFELALTRELVDVGLQPPADWSNYNITEQFQSGSLRYQINFIQWALALQQFARTPAFRGYLSDAQRALFARYQQKKVWSYWFWENLWGNLELNADPIRRQNIMMTGFCALAIGLYETATGDMRYSRPGAFRFRWNDRQTFTYDFDGMCRAMVDDMTRSAWGAMVCEPNWLFAYCNTIGNSALITHDRLHGTNFYERTRPGFERALDEEFLNPDGSLNWYRSTRTGLGLGGQAFANELRPLVPDIADRGWALARRAFVDDGETVSTRLREVETLVDVGNYTFGPIHAYAALIGAAREAGEERLARGALDELLERLALTGCANRPDFGGASLSSKASLGRALFGRKAGWLDMITRGRPAAWESGPLLEAVPYPQVLVARAVSDGSRLELVLRPGTEPGRRLLSLARLVPDKEYDLVGATESSIRADAHGRGTISVDLDGRRSVTAAPRD